MENDKPTDNEANKVDELSTQNEPNMPQNATGAQDTGDSAEVQVKAQAAGIESENIENQTNHVNADSKEPSVPNQHAKWTGLLKKFHNETNGLLAGKENLKIVATNLSAKPSFYRKWSYEANQVMRLTASLRRRIKAANSKAAS